MVDVLPTERQSPQQAFLNAESEIEDMESVAIVWFRKGEAHPRLTCSSMSPVDMNFLGYSLQHYSLKYLKD